MSLKIRNELPADASAIESLTIAAFKEAPHTNGAEQAIVNALRSAGQLTLSLVAQEGEEIVGHVAISPVSISDGSSDWFGLGPVSVLPAYQRRGIGSQLIEATLAELKRRGVGGCVVLGDPAYYARFDFVATPRLVLPGIPAEYFQALLLNGAWPNGEVAYHEAFNATP
jgi:predicted N-acetyltransferase YhbS